MAGRGVRLLGGASAAAAATSAAKCSAITRRLSLSDSVASPCAASKGRPTSTTRRTCQARGRCRCRRASRRSSQARSRGCRSAAALLNTTRPSRRSARRISAGSGTTRATGAARPSPTTHTCATASSSARVRSTSAGGSFTPLASTITSLSRPVITRWPASSIAATSPVSSHSGTAATAPCGASTPSARLGVFTSSCPRLSGRSSKRTSTPASGGPTVPVRAIRGFESATTGPASARP